MVICELGITSPVLRVKLQTLKVPMGRVQARILCDVDAEVRKDVVDEPARVAHGLQALRRSVFRERHQGDELVHVERFPAGDHLVGREAGKEHGEIDGAAGGAVDVVEFDACFGERLDDAGLVGHAHAAAGEDERTPGSGHDHGPLGCGQRSGAGRRGELHVGEDENAGEEIEAGDEHGRGRECVVHDADADGHESADLLQAGPEEDGRDHLAARAKPAAACPRRGT